MTKRNKNRRGLLLVLAMLVAVLCLGTTALAVDTTTLYTGGGTISATGWQMGENGVATGSGNLPTPTLVGATLEGWYTDAALTTGKVAADTAAGAGPYYAKWTRTSVQIQGASMTTRSTANGATAWGNAGNQYTSAFFGNAGFLTFWTDRSLTAGGGSTDVYGGTPITNFPVDTSTDVFVETKSGVFVAAVPTVEGGFVRMNYYVQNRGSAPVNGFTLGAAGDSQLGSNDFVPLNRGHDSGYDYLAMVDKTAGTELRLLTSGKSLTTPDRLWWGGYQPRDNQNRKGFTQNVLNNGKDSRYQDGIDSAFAFSWTNITLQPGETRHYAVALGVGRLGEVTAANLGSTITYDADGGAGAPTDGDKYMPGTAVTVKSGVPTRAGYDFKGWRMSRHEVGTLLNTGDSFTAQGDVTLYAQWKQHTQTVTVSLYEVDTPISGHKVTLRSAFGFVAYPLTETDTLGTYTSNDIPKAALNYAVLIDSIGTPFHLEVGTEGIEATFRYGHVAVNLTQNDSPIMGKYVTLNQHGALAYVLPLSGGSYQLGRIATGTYDLVIDGKSYGALEVTGSAPTVKTIATTEYQITLNKDNLPWVDAEVSLVGEDGASVSAGFTGGVYTALLPSRSYKLLVNGKETQMTLTADSHTKQPDFFTVSFYNGETRYGKETPQRTLDVLSGQLAAEPFAPSSGVEVFTGWKTADGGTVAVDFADPITAATKIYASWETPRVIPSPIIKGSGTYTLSDPKIVGYPAGYMVSSVTVEVDSGSVALKSAGSGDTALGSDTGKLIVVFGTPKSITDAEGFLKEQLTFTMAAASPQQVTITVRAKS